MTEVVSLSQFWWRNTCGFILGFLLDAFVVSGIKRNAAFQTAPITMTTLVAKIGCEFHDTI